MSEVAIIGAGPAGCAAAIQLKRYGIDPIVFEKRRVGGLLLNANLVENYPGFPAGIPGKELASLFEEHLARVGVELCHSGVVELGYEQDSGEGEGIFLVRTEEESFRLRIVVIASGTRAKRLKGLQISEEAEKRVVDGVFSLLGEHEKRVAVVGGGDAAFDYALSLSRRNNHVFILNRSKKRRCLPLLWREVMQDRRIEYKEETQIAELGFSRSQLHVVCRQRLDLILDLLVDYLIVAIGRTPETGYISRDVWKCSSELESRQRLHFIGDVKRGMFRQTGIAVGDGVYAAMKIHEVLREERECAW